jgi:hypothetical protein
LGLAEEQENDKFLENSLSEIYVGLEQLTKGRTTFYTSESAMGEQLNNTVGC